MDQLQEMFGALVEEQLGAMDWAPVKREADGETAPANRGKAARTELGKGRPGSQAPSNKPPWPPWRRAGGNGRHTDGPQETALKIIRQDYSRVLFVQPGNQGPLPLLYAAAQKWKKAQEENTTTTTLRTALFGCLIQTLHTGLKDIGSEGSAPFQKKAEEMKWLKDGLWSYQKWSPALGSLVADEARTPLPHTKLMEALIRVLPLLTQPHMMRRFHATRPLTGNMTGITTFQLDISNRTSGHQQVWECLEAMTGLTALQAIGLQLHTQAVTGRLLLIKLLNSSNTCYMNASIRAWLYAVSHTQVADILKYGQREQAWRDVYHVRRPTHAHALQSWRPLLRNWAQMHRQHDAGEFLEHILGIDQPQVLQGRWESRIVSVEEGTESRGHHVTQRAITLDFPNPDEPTTLQNLINHWHSGETYLQACTHLPRIMILRISRLRAGPMGGNCQTPYQSCHPHGS